MTRGQKGRHITPEPVLCHAPVFARSNHPPQRPPQFRVPRLVIAPILLRDDTRAAQILEQRREDQPPVAPRGDLGVASYTIQPVSPAFATFTATYQWDDEGRMTSMSPSLSLPTSWPNSASFPAMGYQYDANGRLSTLTANGSNFATATYYPAGQLYQLSYGGLTETDTYNSMMQLINQYIPNYLNMNHNYSPTQNNGRITSSVDYATGENTSYTYDALNRLVGASNSLWSGTYTYDGFGNLLSKSDSGGSPNGFPSMTASYNANNQLTTATYDSRVTRSAATSKDGLTRMRGNSATVLLVARAAPNRRSGVPLLFARAASFPTRSWGSRSLYDSRGQPRGACGWPRRR
jgi:YD repeat-containing protein